MTAIDIPSHVLETARTATFSKDEITKAARQVATFGVEGPSQKDIPHSVALWILLLNWSTFAA